MSDTPALDQVEQLLSPELQDAALKSDTGVDGSTLSAEDKAALDVILAQAGSDGQPLEVVSVEVIDPQSLPPVIVELSKLLKARATAKGVFIAASEADGIAWNSDSFAVRHKAAAEAQAAGTVFETAEADLTTFFAKGETRDALHSIIVGELG